MAPSFFSWLGSGTSRRGFPVTPSGGPSFDCVCSAVADLEDEDEMNAAGPVARNGMRAAEGLAAGLLAIVTEMNDNALSIVAYLAELEKLLISAMRRTWWLSGNHDERQED